MAAVWSKVQPAAGMTATETRSWRRYIILLPFCVAVFSVSATIIGMVVGLGKRAESAIDAILQDDTHATDGMLLATPRMTLGLVLVDHVEPLICFIMRLMMLFGLVQYHAMIHSVPSVATVVRGDKDRQGDKDPEVSGMSCAQNLEMIGAKNPEAPTARHRRVLCTHSGLGEEILSCHADAPSFTRPMAVP